jgi:hypothetical protein
MVVWNFYFSFNYTVPGVTPSIHKLHLDLGMVVHSYNPSTKEAEAEGPQVQGQSGA